MTEDEIRGLKEDVRAAVLVSRTQELNHVTLKAAQTALEKLLEYSTRTGTGMSLELTIGDLRTRLKALEDERRDREDDKKFQQRTGKNATIAMLLTIANIAWQIIKELIKR